MPLDRPGLADKFLPFSATIERRGDLAKIRERCRSCVKVLGGPGVRLELLHELETGIDAIG